MILRGTRQKKWVGKWREDVIEPSGRVRRIQRREVIGTKEEYPTRKLAQRALDQRLSDVNSLTYRARPTATFRDFATKWQNIVLTQHKPVHTDSRQVTHPHTPAPGVWQCVPKGLVG